MQCNSCQFENMPGVASCGRCGATTIAALKAIDVYPPRARPGIKPWRSKFYFLYRLRSPFPKVEDNIRRQIEALFHERLPWGVFCRMIAPGWPQFYLGRTRLGRIFLGGYLASMLLGLLYAGTIFGGMLLGGAIACHASSILNITITRFRDLSARIFYSLACFFLLMTLLYGPATWMVSRTVVPQQFIVDIPPINAGDVVLYRPRDYRDALPQVGDLVMYMLPNRVVINPNVHTQYNIGEQAIVGRIIAVPGQMVTIQNKQFYVEGLPSPWQLSAPLDPDADAGLLPRLIPSDCYYIISDIGQIEGLPSVPMTARHREVNLLYILGKIFWRTQPLTRFGRLE